MTFVSRSYQWLFLAVVVLVAIWARFYNIHDTVIFQADQGRDALIVSHIFKYGNLVAIGPTTSVGNLYLGPFYYYFMMPFLWLTYPSPFGPVYAVAALGVLTAGLFYWWGKTMIGPRAGMISGFLYAVSAMMAQFNRFSWNPNIVPFFALAMIVATYYAWQKSPRYWVAVALCFSILLQLHYITILMALGAGVIWLIQVSMLAKAKQFGELKNLVLWSALSAIVVVGSFAPVLAFDVKYNGLNSSAFVKLFTKEKILTGEKEFTVSEYIQKTTSTGLERLEYVAIERVFRTPTLFWFTLLITGTILVTTWGSKDYRPAKIVVWSYLILGLLGLSTYQFLLFDHYLLFLMPAVFLAWGIVLAELSRSKLTVPLAVAALTWIIVANVQKMPFKGSDWSVDDMKRVAAEISPKLRTGEKYDVVLLSESGDIVAYNYRYWLSTGAVEPMFSINGEGIETIVVINENYQGSLFELGLPMLGQFEKAQVETWQVSGGPQVTILRK